jgi:ketosteroid isomerase-like protein
MATLATEQFTQQDQAAVRARFDACPGYVNAGDWASWSEMYSEDGILQPPNAPTVRGRAQLRAWGEAFPAIERFAFSDVETWGEGNIAYGTSGYILKMKDLPIDTGKQLVVFRRGADGSWSVVACSFSSDLAAPGPAARP